MPDELTNSFWSRRRQTQNIFFENISNYFFFIIMSVRQHRSTEKLLLFANRRFIPLLQILLSTAKIGRCPDQA